MWKKIKEYMEIHQMLDRKDVVIVGVSGGADSMCLLFVLKKMKEETGHELIAVHVNHGLRGEEADADEAYVERMCKQWEIPLEVFHVNVKAFAKEHRLSEEEAGRVLRRACFDETMNKYQGTKIALAHHMDDNVETFVLNLSRGSKLRGLGGMKPVNGTYIRPLLEVRRGEIEAFIKAEGISYCEDASNATDAYTRNRVRAHILPALCEHVNTGSVEHISQTMKYFRQVQEYLDRQMAMLWKDMVEESRDTIVLKKELWHQEFVMQSMIIRNALAKVAGSEKDIEEHHVEAVLKLMEKQVGKSLSLPYQMTAHRIYEGIKLFSSEKLEETDSEITDLRLKEDSEGRIEFKDYVVNWKVFKKTKEHSFVPKKAFTKWFDYDIISKSVCVRTRQPGDRIVIDHSGNTQKLKKYFVNEKIPEEYRDKIPVIAEAEDVLWIVGCRQSMAYQITDKTNTILEIEICGGTKNGRKN